MRNIQLFSNLYNDPGLNLVIGVFYLFFGLNISKIQPKIKVSPPSGVINPIIDTGNPLRLAVPITNSDPENITVPIMKAKPDAFKALFGLCFESAQTSRVASVWIKR